MGKPTIFIGENKDADQLRGNREADQRLCFRYSDSTIPPLLNTKISDLFGNHVVGFPTRWLIYGHKLSQTKNLNIVIMYFSSINIENALCFMKSEHHEQSITTTLTNHKLKQCFLRKTMSPQPFSN